MSPYALCCITITTRWVFKNHFLLKNRIHDSDGLKTYLLTQKNNPPQNITYSSNLYYSFQNSQVLGCKTFKQWNWGTCETGFSLGTAEIGIIKHSEGTSLLIDPYVNLIQPNTKMINFYLLHESAPMEEKLSPPHRSISCWSFPPIWLLKTLTTLISPLSGQPPSTTQIQSHPTAPQTV